MKEQLTLVMLPLTPAVLNKLGYITLTDDSSLTNTLVWLIEAEFERRQPRD